MTSFAQRLRAEGAVQPSKFVSVIIPSLRRPDLLERCLRSLTFQTLPTTGYEIVVVENDADTNVSRPFPSSSDVRRVLLSANYGITGAINYGIAVSSSKYVLLLNNDVELDANYLATLLSSLEGNEQYAFAAGKLLSAFEKARLDGAGDALLLGGGAYRLGHKDLDTGQFNKESLVLAVCGAAALFRRSVLEEVRGLDSDFFAYLDDIDLSLRCQLLGYKGIYIPSAVAWHVGSATLGDSFHPKIVELLTRNQLFLIEKDYPLGMLLRLLPRVLVFQLLWLMFVIRRRALLPYLRGVWGAIRLLPRMLRKRRQVMTNKRITSAEFLSLLCHSERQVYTWHKSQSSAARSELLNIYFGLFGAPQGDLVGPLTD